MEQALSAALAGLLAALAGGCSPSLPSHPERRAAGAGAPGERAPERAAEEDSDGGLRTDSVRIAVDTEPAHLNPDLDPDRWGFAIAHDAIYEPLWRARADGGFEGVLADRFTIEDEGRKITFHLRPGVTFHDGVPLHATDVVFTFDKIRASRAHAPRVAAALADLDHAELGGDNTVRVWASRPSLPLQHAIAEIAILPEHVFGRGDLAYQGGNRHPVGTGPLKLREWERGRRIVLERWARYWGPPAPARTIEIAIEPDAAASLGEARRGELDVVARVPPAWVPEQLDSPSLRGRFRAVREPTARFSFVLWNAQRPPLDDPAVRRALQLAVDRDKLLAEVRHGVGRAIASPLLDGAEGPAPRFDLAAAAAQLEAAGLARPGNDGPLLRGGRPVRLSLLVPSGSREAAEAAKRIVASLGKLGIAVEPAVGDLAVLMMRMRKGAFDGVLLEWSGRSDEDLAPLFRSRGAQNFGGYASRDSDVLLDALRAERNGEARRALFGRLAAQLAADPPALFLYSPDEVYLIARRLGAPRRSGDFVLLRDVAPAAAP